MYKQIYYAKPDNRLLKMMLIIIKELKGVSIYPMRIESMLLLRLSLLREVLKEYPNIVI
tara:strand:- start:1275 stop:1451 length:177 start_codon:yes stop_codon:yes gene_type:complete